MESFTIFIHDQNLTSNLTNRMASCQNKVFKHMFLVNPAAVEMNLSNMSIQELKDAIQKFESPNFTNRRKDSSILIPVLDEYTNEYNARLKTSWNEFTRILLPEYFIYVSKLAQIMREGNSSELIRRAFFCSHYGMVLSEVLDLEQFAELRGFYPKLTLPVIPDPNLDINSLFHEGLPLGLH